MIERNETALRILIAARELISVSDRWTQGSRGRRADGRPVEPTSKYAVCWCPDGAIVRASKRQPFDLRIAAWRAVTEVVNQTWKQTCIESWNDHPKRQHAEVVSVFDRAIELMKAGIDV